MDKQRMQVNNLVLYNTLPGLLQIKLSGGHPAITVDGESYSKPINGSITILEYNSLMYLYAYHSPGGKNSHVVKVDDGMEVHVNGKEIGHFNPL